MSSFKFRGGGPWIAKILQYCWDVISWIWFPYIETSNKFCTGDSITRTSRDLDKTLRDFHSKVKSNLKIKGLAITVKIL